MNAGATRAILPGRAAHPDAGPRYARFRAEGLRLREVLRHLDLYLLKYLLKRRDAPAPVLQHFREQRALLCRVREEGPRRPVAAVVRLGLVGDLMWIRSNWDTFLAEELRQEMSAWDAHLGNLETPVSDRHAVPGLLPDYLRYNSSPGLLRSFRRPGGSNLFAAVSLANNHAFDHGDFGLERTLAFLKSEGVLSSGVERAGEEGGYAAFDRGGIRFGFHAATWGVNDPDALRGSAYRVNLLGDAFAALAAMARDGVEFKVLSLHWGHEFELYPTAEQIRLGQALVDAGADLILGHHPHVPQPLEIRRRAGGAGGRGLILYSLGNFTTAMYTPACRVGVLQGLEVYRYDSGEVGWGHPTRRWVQNRRGKLLLLESPPPWLGQHLGEEG
jgi:hypothetical protein